MSLISIVFISLKKAQCRKRLDHKDLIGLSILIGLPIPHLPGLTLLLHTHGKHFKAATHKIKANNGNRKATNTSTALPAPLPAPLPLGGLSSDLTMTPCEGEQCSDQISYDKAEFDKKGWSTPKWCHGCKKARNAARLATNNAGPGSAGGIGNSNLSVDAGKADDAADSDDELAKSLAEADGGKVVHFELFGGGNLAIGESVSCVGYDSDDLLANSVNAAESRKATFQWAGLPSEGYAVKCDTTLKAPGCDACDMSMEMAEAIVECEQQNAACKLKASLEAAELALANRAGAGDNGLPVLSNTTLEQTCTGADALISESVDGFSSLLLMAKERHWSN